MSQSSTVPVDEQEGERLLLGRGERGLREVRGQSGGRQCSQRVQGAAVEAVVGGPGQRLLGGGADQGGPGSREGPRQGHGALNQRHQQGETELNKL